MNGPKYKLNENLNNTQIFFIQFRDRSCYNFGWREGGAFSSVSEKNQMSSSKPVQDHKKSIQTIIFVRWF